ncbi:MAG: O-antigen ligase family protein [Desulfobulbaceae bacterium]
MAVIQHVQQAAGRGSPWLVALLAFSLPLSTSAVTVLAFLILLLWALTGEYGRKFREIFQNKVCMAVLAYLALHLLGLLWTEDTGAGLEMLAKQWKLMLLPVLLTSLRSEHRRPVLYFFLTGLTLMMATTYLAWLDLYHYGGVTPDHPTRRLFHVVYNPMLAFGCYLTLHEVLWGGGSPWRRAGMLALALAMAFDMFITEGRAGQLAFFVLLTLLVFQYFRKDLRKGLLVAAIAVPLLFAGGYVLSPTFQQRVDSARHEIAIFDSNPNTSIGLRLLFWKNSWRIIKAKPLIGAGTGDFQLAYAWVNMQFSPAMVATDNPHNQYVLVLCQLGLMGLVALLAIFVLQVRAALQSRDDLRRLRLALPVLFLTIMLTESYLIVYETGFFFSLFSAVLFKDAESGVAGEE